jgi:hypothetical protein
VPFLLGRSLVYAARARDGSALERKIFGAGRSGPDLFQALHLAAERSKVSEHLVDMRRPGEAVLYRNV